MNIIGEICGSVMLDERFETFLKETIGKQSYQKMSASSKQHALQRWEVDIKPSYSGPGDEDDLLTEVYILLVGCSPVSYDLTTQTNRKLLTCIAALSIVDWKELKHRPAKCDAIMV